MQDLSELYQEVILDHNRSPRNNHEMTCPCHHAEGFNPLCGDKLSLFLKIEMGVVVDASFVGKGCAISTASASIMTDLLKGKTIDEAKTLFDAFHELVTTETDEANDLGKLNVLAGVKQFPSRVKCATLAWHTMLAAIEKQETIISTE
jgi:nitrogen fixation NifU-like protein